MSGGFFLKLRSEPVKMAYEILTLRGAALPFPSTSFGAFDPAVILTLPIPIVTVVHLFFVEFLVFG